MREHQLQVKRPENPYVVSQPLDFLVFFVKALHVRHILFTAIRNIQASCRLFDFHGAGYVVPSTLLLF